MTAEERLKVLYEESRRNDRPYCPTVHQDFLIRPEHIDLIANLVVERLGYKGRLDR